MKYLYKYKLFEIKHRGIDYSDDWKLPNNPIRRKISMEIDDIFIDLKDIGYRIHTGGWIRSSEHPYIWIANKTDKTGSRLQMDWVIIEDYVERAKNYLEINGFEYSEVKLKNQMSIYFYK